MCQLKFWSVIKGKRGAWIVEDRQQCLPYVCQVSSGNVQYVFGIYKPRSEMGSELKGGNLHLRSMNSFHSSPAADTVSSPQVSILLIFLSATGVLEGQVATQLRNSAYQPLLQVDVTM